MRPETRASFSSMSGLDVTTARKYLFTTVTGVLRVDCRNYPAVGALGFSSIRRSPRRGIYSMAVVNRQINRARPSVSGGTAMSVDIVEKSQKRCPRNQKAVDRRVEMVINIERWPG